VNQRLVLRKTAEFVKKRLEKDSTGHDWWHTYRVWRMSIRIAKSEKDVDLFVVELAALLHDVADWKFHSGDESIGPKTAKKWLESLDIEKNVIIRVCEIISLMTFKVDDVKNKINTIEGMIVQDADRLDALGAVGIARTFAFGGSVGRDIYNPAKKAKMHMSFEEYIKSSSINHFYEKLLLLKDKMNTKPAKAIAIKRHKFMQQYLKEFFKEWKAK
jgi:uncharacterized protein